MIKRLGRSYKAFEDYFCGGLVFIGLSLIMLNVILRYFFNQSRSILDEFSTYFMIWGTLAGTAVALRDDHHIKVDMLFIRLPIKLQRWVSVIAHIIGIFFGLFYTFYGSQLVGRYYTSGQVSTDSSFPLWIVYLIMPVSGLMFIFRILTKLYLLFKNGGADWHRANSGEV
ncbi:TRAP transporter small permease [Paradesulfitobacterium ferrireducens]|uniref:TRAP transporter small permease n=1 Tax=Paradesulfitobacterium ferrireducens TaxID=2816476 RepID=UPI001AD8BA5A|nr:TRAP transporter small permease [Paradesulfitobacterium ferrireducens]